MSQATTQEGPRGYSRKPKIINLRFFPAGAGVPTYSAQDTKGVASIVRNNAGEYLITLTDAYNRLISAQATIQMASATDLVPQFATISNLGTATPTTLLLRANAVATPTDIAANANNSISATLIFDDANS